MPRRSLAPVPPLFRLADFGARTATGGVAAADTNQYRLLEDKHSLAGRRLALLAQLAARIHRDLRDTP